MCYINKVLLTSLPLFGMIVETLGALMFLSVSNWNCQKHSACDGVFGKSSIHVSQLRRLYLEPRTVHYLCVVLLPSCVLQVAFMLFSQCGLFWMLSQIGRRHKGDRVMKFNEPASTGLTDGNRQKTQKQLRIRKHSRYFQTRMHKSQTGYYGGKTRTHKVKQGKTETALQLRRCAGLN